MRMPWLLAIAGVVVLIAAAFYLRGGSTTVNEAPVPFIDQAAPPDQAAVLEQATLGSGCFWCTEAVFQQLRGVQQVVSGYSGGETKDPTYDDICQGTTGHAEVVRVTFDPRQLSYADVLEAFWKSHDPTTLNRQGADVGTQYRSVVLYHSEQQRALAEEYRARLDASGAYSGPIVTQIVPAGDFYPAERYHQNYYQDNPRQGYCQVVIRPKLDKFRAAFKDKLKP